jgi:hypothetical protein
MNPLSLAIYPLLGINYSFRLPPGSTRIDQTTGFCIQAFKSSSLFAFSLSFRKKMSLLELYHKEEGAESALAEGQQ